MFHIEVRCFGLMSLFFISYLTAWLTFNCAMTAFRWFFNASIEYTWWKFWKNHNLFPLKVSPFWNNFRVNIFRVLIFGNQWLIIILNFIIRNVTFFRSPDRNMMWRKYLSFTWTIDGSGTDKQTMPRIDTVTPTTKLHFN